MLLEAVMRSLETGSEMRMNVLSKLFNTADMSD